MKKPGPLLARSSSDALLNPEIQHGEGEANKEGDYIY